MGVVVSLDKEIGKPALEKLTALVVDDLREVNSLIVHHMESQADTHTHKHMGHKTRE